MWVFLFRNVLINQEVGKPLSLMPIHCPVYICPSLFATDPLVFCSELDGYVVTQTAGNANNRVAVIHVH